MATTNLLVTQINLQHCKKAKLSDEPPHQQKINICGTNSRAIGI